jgi:choline dehydrogenase-like flavoprotein
MALANRDIPICLVDAAIDADEDMRTLRERLGSVEPAEWTAGDIQSLKRRTIPTSSGVEAKLDFGSDHVYRVIPGAPRFEPDGAEMLRSFARGGLSNVWGASILPYPENELDDWPIAADSLREHYKSVLEFVPFCGTDDDLSELFPEMGDRFQSMPGNRQQDCLMRDLNRSRDSLAGAGIRFGHARLAVDATGPSTGFPCQRCGLCLYGCPYELIYSSKTTLDAVLARDNVEHRPGIWVRRIEPKRDGLRIYARNIDTGEETSIEAEKVFLAAGIVETARIVLESTKQYNVPVTGLHSDRITMPMIRFQRDKGVCKEPMHTLSQVFLEILDATISDKVIHVQIYGYNDLMPGALSERLRRFGLSGIGRLDSVLLERLMVAFAYLHSSISSKIEYVLRPNGELRVTGKPSAAAARACRQLGNKLRMNGLRFRSLFGYGKLHLPGGGNHSGGTFPMKHSPGTMQCDVMGELHGMPGLHIVDSSVLPSLSSTTITLAAMANAHRIASETP